MHLDYDEAWLKTNKQANLNWTTHAHVIAKVVFDQTCIAFSVQYILSYPDEIIGGSHFYKFTCVCEVTYWK